MIAFRYIAHPYYQKRTYPILTKDAGVSEYANFKEEWLEILDHLGDDKMALRDLDKNTPDSIPAMDLLLEK